MSSKPEDKAEPVSADWRDVHGPFDIIGDVHGCADELIALLAKLGYSVRLEGTGDDPPRDHHGAEGPPRVLRRRPRRPRTELAGRAAHRHGYGRARPGVLGDRQSRRQVPALSQGPRRQAGARPRPHRRAICRRRARLCRTRTLAFLETLPSHAWLDDGRLAVAHAGVRENMLGKQLRRGRTISRLYGDTSGRPGRRRSAGALQFGADYRGKTAVVYGHTPVAEPEWLNNTVCIDTGCVFGGKLTALRWPERELVSVPARQAHAALRRPFGLPPARPAAEAISRDPRLPAGVTGLDRL